MPEATVSSLSASMTLTAPILTPPAAGRRPLFENHDEPGERSAGPRERHRHQTREQPEKRVTIPDRRVIPRLCLIICGQSFVPVSGHLKSEPPASAGNRSGWLNGGEGREYHSLDQPCVPARDAHIWLWLALDRRQLILPVFMRGPDDHTSDDQRPQDRRANASEQIAKGRQICPEWLHARPMLPRFAARGTSQIGGA